MVSTLTLDQFSKEIILHISTFADADIDSIKAVCKSFHQVVAEMWFNDANAKVGTLYPDLKKVVAQGKASNTPAIDIFKSLIGSLHHEAQRLGCEEALPQDSKSIYNLKSECSHYRALAAKVNEEANKYKVRDFKIFVEEVAKQIGADLQNFPLQTAQDVETAWDFLKTLGLDKVSKLSINTKELYFLTPEISKLTSLSYLCLGSNKLQSLPREIGQLINLEELLVTNNQLRNLPSQIGKLKKLTKLILTLNILRNLPAEIGQLINLEVCYLDKNQLQNLPPDIVHLAKMKFFNLSDNKLKNIPPLGNLADLQVLCLENNELQSLPSEFDKLTKLEKIKLRNNKLNSIPFEILQLKSLKLDKCNF